MLEIDENLKGFILERDSFYLGTAGADGQPYIQHRGGKPGFLKIIDDTTLGFVDFAGNRQYITLGNLEHNDRAFIFLMDYANRRRVKIWGRMRAVHDDPALIESLRDDDYKAKIERAFVFTIERWDVNCPAHITPRFTEAMVQPEIQKLQTHIKELETELNFFKSAAASRGTQ